MVIDQLLRLALYSTSWVEKLKELFNNSGSSSGVSGRLFVGRVFIVYVVYYSNLYSASIFLRVGQMPFQRIIIKMAVCVKSTLKSKDLFPVRIKPVFERLSHLVLSLKESTALRTSSATDNPVLLESNFNFFIWISAKCMFTRFIVCSIYTPVLNLSSTFYRKEQRIPLLPKDNSLLR